MAIGIFDSGVGGLSVWRVLRRVFPQDTLIYLADQAYLPYSSQTQQTLIERSEKATRFLHQQSCELIVIACNTATAAAVDHLRQQLPQLPIVGMEPAIKPAVQQTQSGIIGVLATASTLASTRYAHLTQRFAQQVTLLENPCLELAPRIERGEQHTADTQQYLHTIVQPMLDQQADTFVLGCTHYPFIEPVLRQLVGPRATIIDPAEAVARQVGRLRQPNPTQNGDHHFYTTGSAPQFQAQINRLLPQTAPTNSSTITFP